LEGVFEFRGRRLRVIGNHLSSRFGSTPVFGATQPFVQAGEPARAAQVRSLHDYAASLLATESEAWIAVLGDMNTFEFSDELAELLPGSPPALYPLMSLVPQEERYSYNYEGNSQTLDHVFVSPALRDIAEVDVVHLNTDFPAIPGLTASDHDPVVARVAN
jgi:predicted extracellular nuclease